MDSSAVVFSKPREIALRRLALNAPQDGDVVLETLWSGISTGTEKMFFEGSMPPFPGMGYPLVPGYESVARVVEAGRDSPRKPGDLVFVPGANCYRGTAGLFGATASRLVASESRVIPVPEELGERAVLLALAATAHHAVVRARGRVGLVIGHGVLGRLVARTVIALGAPPPVVWERDSARRAGALGYEVVDEARDATKGHSAIVDASGSVAAIDAAISRLARGGELVLAGFYGERLDIGFVPAFMREISLHIAAEFRPEDVEAVLRLVAGGRLSLDGLLTHRASSIDAPAAYRTAFEDPDCLKMIIDWRLAA
ncbi:chlorophyll synthesis pathway protein BchC [Zhengella sp. ZM62]|uniref:chlorophyll synthesis pathway protein BchC n=1 Tax=Zhengella sedimenti TaxID=3390035 RepID=UPI0039765879